MVYDIWSEGFCCTGQSGTAQCVARNVEADSFIDAVRKWYNSEPDAKNKYGDLSIKKDKAFLWGCKLFDNEADARKSFG